MNPNWLWWAYLAGVPLALSYAALRIGQNWDDWTASRYSGDAAVFKAACSLLLATIWPVALWVVAFFTRGANLTKARKATNQRLKAAEAEINRIRRAEGWTS